MDGGIRKIRKFYNPKQACLMKDCSLHTLNTQHNKYANA